MGGGPCPLVEDSMFTGINFTLGQLHSLIFYSGNAHGTVILILDNTGWAETVSTRAGQQNTGPCPSLMYECFMSISVGAHDEALSERVLLSSRLNRLNVKFATVLLLFDHLTCIQSLISKFSDIHFFRIPL